MTADELIDICDNCRRAYWHGKRSVEMPGTVIADAAPEPVRLPFPAHSPDCLVNRIKPEHYEPGLAGISCTCGALDRAKLLRDVKAVTDGSGS